MILLFDLDNTLLDDRSTKKYYLPKLYYDFKHLINDDLNTFSENWISAINKYYKLYSEGLLTYTEQREKRIIEAFNNEKLNSDEISKILLVFDKHFKNSWTLYKEWDTYLSSSKVDRAIVTNGSEKQQMEKINKLNLNKYFKDIFISGKIGVSKPNPLIFKYVCNKLNVLPSDCIFIGDSWYYDIKSSNQFGMKSFWINHKNESPKLTPKNIETFNSISNLIARLKEIETNANNV